MLKRKKKKVEWYLLKPSKKIFIQSGTGYLCIGIGITVIFCSGRKGLDSIPNTV